MAATGALLFIPFVIIACLVWFGLAIPTSWLGELIGYPKWLAYVILCPFWLAVYSMVLRAVVDVVPVPKELHWGSFFFWAPGVLYLWLIAYRLRKRKAD